MEGPGELVLRQAFKAARSPGFRIEDAALAQRCGTLAQVTLERGRTRLMHADMKNDTL
jgi:hypothetical protein